MTITIDISPKAEETLKKEAEKLGKDFPEFIEYIVEREAMSPLEEWNELVRPIRDETKRLGLSEKDIEELIDSELAAYRLENPLRCR